MRHWVRHALYSFASLRAMARLAVRSAITLRFPPSQQAKHSAAAKQMSAVITSGIQLSAADWLNTLLIQPRNLFTAVAPLSKRPLLFAKKDAESTKPPIFETRGHLYGHRKILSPQRPLFYTVMVAIPTVLLIQWVSRGGA